MDLRGRIGKSKIPRVRNNPQVKSRGNQLPRPLIFLLEKSEDQLRRGTSLGIGKFSVEA